MKSLIRYFLCLCLLAQAPAGWCMTGRQSVELAQELTLKESPRAFQLMRTSAATLEKTLKTMADSKPAEVTAHTGQTLLFLLTVAGVDLVYQEIQKRGGLGSLKGSDMTSIAAAAASEIATAAMKLPNSGSLWMSMAGASVASKLLEAPVAALSAVIANPESNRILFQGLQSSILLTGATLGWDLGSQLATEASYLLTDPDDYARSGDLFGVGKGAIFALLFSNDLRDQKDLALAGKMFRNVLEVALFNSDLRAKWLNNTWRTKWMTGETVTFLGMVAASTIAGTMILPGGGTVAGFMFGVAGAVASWALPDSFKNDITLGLQTVRQQVIWAGQLHTNEMGIRGDLARPLFAYVTTDEMRLQKVRQDLALRHGYRSDYLTICFERIRNYVKLMTTNSNNIASSRDGIRGAFKDAHDFLDGEHRVVSQFVIEASKPGNAGADFSSPMRDEVQRVEFLEDFMQNLGDELENSLNEQSGSQFDFKTLSPSGQEIVKYIEVAYARGFREDDLLKSARDHEVLDRSATNQ